MKETHRRPPQPKLEVGIRDRPTRRGVGLGGMKAMTREVADDVDGMTGSTEYHAGETLIPSQ
jgi:hypothetical protein